MKRKRFNDGKMRIGRLEKRIQEEEEEEEEEMMKKMKKTVTGKKQVTCVVSQVASEYRLPEKREREREAK